MKKLLLFFLLAFIAIGAQSQSVFVVRQDTIKMIAKGNNTTMYQEVDTFKFDTEAEFFEFLKPIKADEFYIRDTTLADFVAEHGGGSLIGVMQAAKAQVLYTNTTQTTIITLPINAVIWNIGLNIITLFDGSGTDLLVSGITGEGDRYMANVNLSSVYFDQTMNANVMPVAQFADEMTGNTNITFTYTDQNSDATQGQAFIYIHYTTF